MRIYGTNLLAHGGSIALLSFAGVDAEEIVSQSNLVVTARVAAGDDVTGDVLIVADTGATVTHTNGWKYIVAPTIDDVSPAI